jgi:hypothetical protein
LDMKHKEQQEVSLTCEEGRHRSESFTSEEGRYQS